MKNVLKTLSTSQRLILGSLLAVCVGCTHVPLKNENHLSVIGIRERNGRSEFYKLKSGVSFVPQGVNWVHLSSHEKKAENISFSEPFFSSHKAEIVKTLTEIQKLGFNVVRIRVDAKTISGPKQKLELNGYYVDNLADFIQEANKAELYVILTGQWMPDNYYQIAYSGSFPAPSRETADINQILLSTGMTEAFALYERDLIKELKQRMNDDLSGVFSIDLWNELYFSAKDIPFSKTSGFFVDESGIKYDLGNTASRQALADSATTRWVNAVTSKVKSADPTLLVTASVFTPLEVGRTGYQGVRQSGSKTGDWRQPFRLSVLSATLIDYLQIHPYPHRIDVDLDPDLRSMEFSELKSNKPVLVGEFGVYKADASSPSKAVSMAKSYLGQACKHHFNGWLFWTWDTSEQTDLWNLREDEFTIGNALSPKKTTWCQ